MLRLVTLFLVVGLSAISLCQQSIWTHSVSDTTKPVTVRDSSGNLYLATRATTLAGRQLKVEKFNALGTLIWTSTYQASVGGLDRQFDIQSVAVAPTGVMVIAQERLSEGSGTLQLSHALFLAQSNGSLQFSMSSSDAYVGGAYSNGVYAFLTRNTGTGASTLVLRDNDFNGIATVNLGNTNDVGALVMDPAGNTYVGWTNTSQVSQVSKVSPTGSVLFTTPTDLSNRNQEQMNHLVYDPAADRVIFMASGRWLNAPNDLDVLIGSVNASTGALSSITSQASTTADEFPGDLILARPSGALASSTTPSTTSGTVKRFSAVPTTLWTHNFTLTGQGIISLAQDADNNALLMYAKNPNTLTIEQHALASGSFLETYEVAGSSVASRRLLTDAAGNFFATYEAYGDVLLRRLQPAILGGPSTARVGGTTESGYISTLLNVSANQVWTLSSSNPAVVTVPSTVTLTSGTNVVNFEITLHPVTATTTASINARYGGFITQRQVTVLAPALSSILVAPNTVIGGVPTTAQVILNGKAPTGGRVVTLSSNKPAVASVPANVTIAAGATTAFQAVTTFGVATNQGVVLTATLGAVSKTAFMAVNAPSLTGAFVDPGAVQGGNSATLTLEINGIAPTGGLSIVLHSGAPGIVLVPGTGAVPAGATNGNVTVNTAAVTSSTNVLIFATRAGIYRVATLTVTP